MRSARPTYLATAWQPSDEDLKSVRLRRTENEGLASGLLAFAISAFRRQLKTFLLRGISVLTASEVFLNYSAL